MQVKQNIYPNELSSARRRRHFSQKFVAVTIGKSQKMLSKYERGALLPPMSTAAELSILYQVELPELYPDLYRDLQVKIARSLAK